MGEDAPRSRPGATAHPVADAVPVGASAADVDLASLTPMMRQYREWKRRYPDYLLLFRLGDFYEAFHEDAAVAARTLDIALTSRQKGEGAIPMAGVPHHAVDTYIARLIRAGLKVAVCDQVEAAPPKGRQLIRREVVRLVTPGTVTDAGLLEGRLNNYLAALWRAPDHLGVALVDVTTADFWVGEAGDADGLAEALLLRRPAEVLVPPALAPDDPLLARLRAAGVTVTARDADSFGLREAEDRLRAHFRVAAVEGLGLPRRGGALRAAGAVLAYLHETQQAPPAHLTSVQTLALDDHLPSTSAPRATWSSRRASTTAARRGPCSGRWTGPRRRWAGGSSASGSSGRSGSRGRSRPGSTRFRRWWTRRRSWRRSASRSGGSATSPAWPAASRWAWRRRGTSPRFARRSARCRPSGPRPSAPPIP
jgi:DNA mismatch repair protein MutS